MLLKANVESRLKEKEGLESMAQPAHYARREDEHQGLTARCFRAYTDSDGAGTDGAQ